MDEVFHTVSDAKCVDDVVFLTGCHAHFLTDVLHVDLQHLDTPLSEYPQTARIQASNFSVPKRAW